MPSTSPSSRARKRQRKPSWKAEAMTKRPSKSARLDRALHPQSSDLHDLGESDDGSQSNHSHTRPEVRARIRIKAPRKPSTRNDKPPKSMNWSPPVRLRLRLRVPPERELNQSIVNTGKGQPHVKKRAVPAQIRLRAPLMTEEQQPRSRSAFSLPRDVLLKIFSHLEAVPDLCLVAQVCTQWTEAATVPDLWKTVKASDARSRKLKVEESTANYHYICYDDPFQDVSMGHHKRKSKPRRLRGVRQAVEVITRRGGSVLMSLDLENCFPLHRNDAFQMHNEDLKKISQRCGASLEELRISPSPKISGQALVSLAQSCPKLRVLRMTGCRTLSSFHLGEIVLACPSLEDISVRQCATFRGSRLNERLFPARSTLRRLDISDTLTTRFQLSKFATQFPALEEIKADNCEYMYIMGRPPNQAAVEESIFPSLVSLNVDKISHISLAWLTSICQSCPTLQVLSANKVQQPVSSISSLFQGPLPALQHLSLAGQPLDDEAWQCIFEKLRRSLVQCDVSRNVSLTCVLFAEIGQTFDALEELNISGTGATDWTVQEVMRLAPKLSFLDVSGCRSVENRDLRRNPLAFRFT